MTIERTPAVELACRFASRLAADETCREVSPQHLLLALISQADGAAVNLLLSAGVKTDELRNIVPTKGPQSETGVAFGQRAEEILKLTHHAMREMMLSDPISSDSLLWTLVREDRECRDQLEKIGLSFDRFDQLARDGLQGPPLPMEESLELTTPLEFSPVDRILDANANRAREALRCIEEHCRFVLNDGVLAQEAKSIRHGVTEALGELPSDRLLIARDSASDVGIGNVTTHEKTRTDTAAVVLAGCKRLQEALRVLEEYGKLHSSLNAEKIGQLRYRSYQLEKSLVLAPDARCRLKEVNLCVLVTGAQCWSSLESTIAEVAAGGAQMIQMREKDWDDRQLLAQAKVLRRLTRAVNARFIVNDRPDIAKLVGADGVHLGQQDMPVGDARRLLGGEAIIGVSTHSPEQLRQAVLDGASYVGVGPTFPTTTKEFDSFPGLEYVRLAADNSTIPAFAIGGINLANLPDVIEAGARRVAVGSAICGNETPQALVKAMRQLLDAAPPLQ